MPPDAFLNTGQGRLSSGIVGLSEDLLTGSNGGGGNKSKQSGDSDNPTNDGENRQQISFADQLFCGKPAPIDLLVTIVSTRTKRRERIWEGFVTNRVLFLRGDNLETIELRESVFAVVELAEECLKCRSLIVCLERNSNLVTLIRAFMYLDFEPVDPRVYGHDAERFVLVGLQVK